MRLVETHQIKSIKNKKVDILCSKTKNLYNFINYQYRKVYFENRDRAKAGIKDRLPMPRKFDLMGQYARENQPDYRALPASVSQRLIISVDNEWKAFFALNKRYAKNHKNYKTPPSPPRYKDKKNGRYPAIFTSAGISVEDNKIHFAKNVAPSIKTNIDKKKICEVRIVPCGCVYKIEIVYKREAQDAKLAKTRVLGIDLGVTNLATMVDNTGERQPIVVKGGRVKAENQWYNKRKAFLESCLPEGKGKTRQARQVSLKRNNRIGDALHKTSRFVIDYCIRNNIGTIVVGKNDGWKRDVNIGHRNNQNFVQIPHAKLVDQIKYKAALFCIDFVEQEESHTSKCDALALEPVEHRNPYLGRRKHRGLFVSSTGKQIHADVNGALNIMRKAIGDHNVVLNWGRLARPVSEVLS